MNAITLTVPMPANLANSRMHHMVKHRAKTGYWDSLDILRQLYLSHSIAKSCPYAIPMQPDVPLSPVRLDATMYLGARMDDDNALGRLKWVADWLKTRKYIKDDKRPHCRFTIPEQIIKRDGNYRIDITLTPLG